MNRGWCYRVHHWTHSQLSEKSTTVILVVLGPYQCCTEKHHSVCMVSVLWSLLPSATKLWQGNVFTPVCHSVYGGCLPQCMLGYTPHQTPLLGQTTPSRHTLLGRQPPLGRHPLGRHPPPAVTAADGTHPTGMHSCSVLYRILLSSELTHIQIHVATRIILFQLSTPFWDYLPISGLNISLVLILQVWPDYELFMGLKLPQCEHVRTVHHL